MSKGKALAFVALALFLAMLCLPVHLYACMFPFIGAAMVFGAIAYAKYMRDRNMIASAKQEQLLASRQLPAPPPMSSKGSSRLFVPPPIDRRS